MTKRLKKDFLVIFDVCILKNIRRKVFQYEILLLISAIFKFFTTIGLLSIEELAGQGLAENINGHKNNMMFVGLGKR